MEWSGVPVPDTLVSSVIEWSGVIAQTLKHTPSQSGPKAMSTQVFLLPGAAEPLFQPLAVSCLAVRCGD